MNKFSDLGIALGKTNFAGDRINIKRIFNKEIIVHDYRIEDSKFHKDKGNGKCLHLQIEIGGLKHVVFTISTTLQRQIEKVPKEKFPIATTIVEQDQRFEFR